MSEKTVKVEIEVPECVVKFLNDVSAYTGDQIDVPEYMSECAVSTFKADLNATISHLWNMEKLKKKYGLDKLEGC